MVQAEFEKEMSGCMGRNDSGLPEFALARQCYLKSSCKRLSNKR
jgi:hypothetical protein